MQEVKEMCNEPWGRMCVCGVCGVLYVVCVCGYRDMCAWCVGVYVVCVVIISTCSVENYM